MDLQRIIKRSKCCMLLVKTGVTDKITGVCEEEVLLENLEIIMDRGLRSRITSFPAELQIAILQEQETLQYMLELIKPEISQARIQRLLLQVPLKDLMKYEPADVRKILSDQMITDKFMGIYLKYYREDGLDKADMSKLWKGLEWFWQRRTNLTDDWLGNLGSKRSLFMEPVITGNFIRHIQDYDGCLRMLSQREDVLQLLNALCQVNNGESALDEIAMEELCANTKQLADLWSWAQDFFDRAQLAKFSRLWLQNHALVYDLSHLKKRVESGENIEIESILTGRASYIAFLYNAAFSEKLVGEHEELVIYAFTHKKKTFLNLLRENMELYQEIPSKSILFCHAFYDKCVNINTMNRKNLADCREMMNGGYIAWNLLTEREHTFEELALIYSLPEEYIQLYESFSARRTDERLRVMREIVKKRCLPKGVPLGKLSDHLMQKPLSQWMQQDFCHIENLSHENAVLLLSNYEMLAQLIPDMKNNAEVRYVLNNLTQCEELSSMQEFRRHLLECNEEWKYLADTFDFSEEFIQDNQDRIRQFIFEDGAHIMKIYCEAQRGKLDDIRRLVSAELMGRFKELKYYHDDLLREIDYPVTERQKKQWMNNSREERGELAVWEEDGLLPVMQMGITPHKTCLSYIDGQYKQCLLACHDSNKKVLYLSYKGKVVLRAAIRLTKGAFFDVTKNAGPQMHFADLMVKDVESNIHKGDREKPKEYLTLFLEKAYTAELPERLRHNAYQLILHLMKRKAKEMNALFAASISYQGILGNELIPLYYYMYISRSKAGEQYLDSLGGNKCVDNEGSYRCEKFLMDKRTT